ncbi:uncharacterized protein LOC129912720 [Episyrphus balteatus]|uniref:uncharacterized protein LOC129912720 n=1 Tax=Episyrphus balteatus TaxID=286459 RepID=UPI002485202B|nr:uncharacterized protein LOC129912720 [Episyrphus balteatus]
MEKILNEIKSFLKTLVCFLIACCMVPLLLTSFLCVHYSNELFNYVLTVKYPSLEISKSKKIRTLIDTPRNAGIFHFLLQLQGSCDFEKIKQHYVEHLTELRNPLGGLRFPKLRQQLITCWGHYAWVKDQSSFNINNHVVINTANYRGRKVHDGNIQEFVSDLVTKYIPSDLPQWQVIVIPIVSTSCEEDMADDHFYILVKVHHLLIAEQDGLHTSEILMLNSSNKLSIDVYGTTRESPKLSYFVRKPVHVQNLFNYIWLGIINRWNEFTYHFDSLESPDGVQKLQIDCISKLLSVLLITTVTVLIDFWRANKGIKTSFRARYRLFYTLIRREILRRNISYGVVMDSIKTSLHPFSIFKNLIRIIWYINVNIILLMPYNIYRELLAMKDIIFTGNTTLITFSGTAAVYIPLIIYAQVEVIKICFEIFKAPCNIFEELFQFRSKDANILQVKSYSGRKVVSFSKEIDWTEIRKRVDLTGLRESDVTLACIAGALHEYFDGFEGYPVPKVLNTTCRTMAKGYFTERDGRMNHIGGVVFLQLPLRKPTRENALEIQKIIERIRMKQVIIYLASIGQTKFDMLTAILPRTVTKVFINYFSFNFPVTLTEIYGNSSNFETVWGQNVEYVLLFRPPQSKTCLSLNIHRFGEKSRLAIIADTQLAPDHAKISSSFEKFMETIKM